MLSKILTAGDCAACRNCCVFHEESRWETPVISADIVDKIKEELHDEDSVVFYKDSFSLASVKRDIKLKEGQEIYKCVALDENKGCTLTGDKKPFDCSLWPLRVMEKDNRVFVMIAKGCHSVDDTFLENVNTLLSEGLKERILLEMTKNPDIVKKYVDGYIPVCDITDDLIRNLLLLKDSDACEDCYLGMYVWSRRYGLELLSIGDGYIFKSSRDNSFLFPMPQKKAKSVINELLNTSDKLEFHRITESQKQFIEENFPGKFEFEEDTGSFDYLYEAERLSDLKGKKLAKKRNHINAFLAEFDNWHVEIINENNIEGCVAFAKDWYENKITSINEAVSLMAADNGNSYKKKEERDSGIEEDSLGLDSLNYEREALLRVFENFDKLGAEGILIRCADDIIAFTIGQKISGRTYDVVFEKASEHIRGSYNMINREFVRFLREKYPDLQYINRENDLNLPGLRKAKRSYMPCDMVKKYNAFTI